MKRTSGIKERIIAVTVGLIAKSDGDVASVRIQDIADGAEVGVGLINYHFQTKENLIELCVERMIASVISGFEPTRTGADHASTGTKASIAEKLEVSVKAVFDFLVKNPSVSRISILTDMRCPKKDDNTVMSANAMSKLLGNIGLAENERLVLAFAMTSVMQALFLRKEQGAELFGFDLNEKPQRDKVLDLIVDTFFGGLRNG